MPPRQQVLLPTVAFTLVKPRLGDARTGPSVKNAIQTTNSDAREFPACAGHLLPRTGDTLRSGSELFFAGLAGCPMLTQVF